MNRFRTILYTWCLLLLFGCGVFILVFSPKEATISEYENRMLEAFPSTDIRTVLSGEFALGMERYLSDHFWERQKLISLSDHIMDSLSLLSSDRKAKLAAMDVSIDSEETIEQVAEQEEILSPTASPVSPAQETSFESGPVLEENPETEPDFAAPAMEPAQTVAPSHDSETVSTQRNPLVEYDYRKDKDRDDAVSVSLVKTDGTKEKIAEYKKWYIRDAAYLFNRLADLLPENGRMYVVLAQRGEHVLQYTQALDRYIAYESEAEDYLEPLLKEKITVFRTMDILEPHIRNKEYVYFFTDHHWTTLGAYYVHKAIVESTGWKAPEYDEYKVTRQSKPYSGSNASIAEYLLPKGTKDYVDMIEPSIPYDFYRVTEISELTPYPLNMPDANGYQAILWLNMRPWKMIRGYENTGRKMLLVCDSMGMAFAPFMLYYYDEVHVVRPHSTYYSAKQAGGTIKQYIDYYGINDIYVVQSNFFTPDLYRAELRVSIGDGK